MKALLILKCEGHQMDGFVFCSGTRNIILDLEKISTTPNYVNYIKYLDNVSKLFAGPCVKMNIISNTMFKTHEIGYIDEKMYKYFSYYWEAHKRCSPILEIVLKESV